MFSRLPDFLRKTLRSQKGFSALHILGLSLGLAAFLLLARYVQHEYTFDRFHAHSDRIYRLLDLVTFGGEDRWNDDTLGSVALALRASHPQVESVVRMLPCRNQFVRTGGNTFTEIESWCVESALFDVFSFDLRAADPAAVLDRPQTAVLTASMATQLFGDHDPIGRTFEMKRRDSVYTVEVTGVMNDVPSNSHFHFSLALSHSSLPERSQLSNARQYLLLREDADPAQLTDQIRTYIVDDLQDRWVSDVRLQPLQEVYFSAYEAQRNGDRRYVQILALIALLILGSACANYINLTTAQTLRRAREVGLRKVVGAGRGQLFWQFMGETLVLLTTALVLALVLVQGVLPTFNQFAGVHLSLDPFASPVLLLGLLLLLLIVAFLSGAYPALAFASLPPIRALRGTLRPRPRSNRVRRGLVLFQCTISICLVVGTLVIVQQRAYLQQQPLGFSPDRIVHFLHNTRSLTQQVPAMEALFQQHPNIVATTKTNLLPGQPGFKYDAKRAFSPTGQEADEVSFSYLLIDETYLPLLQIPLIAGRNLRDGLSTEPPHEGILTRTGAQAMGWTPEEALGQLMRDILIVGVTEDFHFQSLHRPMNPLIMTQYFRPFWGGVAMRLGPGDRQETIAALKAQWQAQYPDVPFEVTYLADDVARRFDREADAARLFFAFAALALLIASLGLIGIATFAAQRRRKEIGIRKVLGAQPNHLLSLLVGEYLGTVVLAAMLAAPLSYWAMQQWLNTFAYRAPLTPAALLVATGIMLGVTLLAVGYQTLRATTANPAETLRQE